MIGIPKILHNYRYCTKWRHFISTYIYGVLYHSNGEKTNYFTRFYNTAFRGKSYIKKITCADVKNGKSIKYYHYDWVVKRRLK